MSFVNAPLDQIQCRLDVPQEVENNYEDDGASSPSTQCACKISVHAHLLLQCAFASSCRSIGSSVDRREVFGKKRCTGLTQGGGAICAHPVARASPSETRDGSLAIAAPLFCSAHRSSKIFCKLSQNSAEVPKKRPNRSAVSPVIARWPFNICVMRLTGTSIRRASSAALMPSASRSSRNVSPGWIGSRMAKFLSVVINNLYFGRARTSIGPLETNSPLVVDANAPLSITSTLKCL